MMKNILNFKEFTPVYESMIYESQKSSNAEVVDKEGNPTDDIGSLVDMVMKIEKSGKKIKESNLYEQVSPFKPVKIGENSDRVKTIQKYLGLKEDGEFGKLTEDAVKKFQEENGLKVDGKVGTQTYGKMVELDLNTKDESVIDKKVEAFKKMSDTFEKIKDSILEDPRLYECFESISIIVVGGETRVVCIPKKGAKEKIEEIERSGIITADFSWLKLIGQTIGKAIVFTALSPILVPIIVAKAMISGIISAGKFIKDQATKITMSVFHGISQIVKWSKEKGAKIYFSLKENAEDLWKGFCEGATKAVKGSLEALLALSGAVNMVLKTAGSAYASIMLAQLAIYAKGVGLAWEGIKTLSEAIKNGFKFLADKGADALKKFKEGVSAGYKEAKENAIQIGNTIKDKATDLGKSALKAIGDGIVAIGNQIVSFGSWVGNLAESLYLQTGNPVFETLMF